MGGAEKMGALLKSRLYAVKPATLIYSVLMLFIGLVMITPFVFMISGALKTTEQMFLEPLNIIPDQLNWNNYIDVFRHKYYFIWYMNSFIVVLATVLLRGLFVTLAAYAFARLQFRFKEVLFLIMIAKMMIPPDTTIVARYLLYNYMHLIDTHWALILPAIFDVFFLFLLRQFFMGIPKEISEAGIIDGCSHFKIYYKIILPLAKPAIVTMVLFTFIWIWNDYISPFVFINDIKIQLLTVGLQYFQGEAGADYALQMAGASIAIIPTVILFSFLQRYFIEGIVAGGVKG